MKQCYSFIARTYPDRPGLDLCTPDSDYWMIDDGHIAELRKGQPRGTWRTVFSQHISLRWDLSRWGYNVTKMPRLVMLNIERMDEWEHCEAGMIAIVDQLRAIREDVTICVYGHAGIEHAAGIVDAITYGCNHVARTDAIIPAHIIPTIRPGDMTAKEPYIAISRLHDQGHKTLLLWEVCSHQRYVDVVANHWAISRVWRDMK